MRRVSFFINIIASIEGFRVLAEWSHVVLDTR